MGVAVNNVNKLNYFNNIKHEGKKKKSFYNLIFFY